MTVTLTPLQARRVLLHGCGLTTPAPPTVSALLESLGAFQLDPIDRIGTSPDLVVFARGVPAQRGDWWSPQHEGVAFEHFAKERCQLPARLFPLWRDRLGEARWWRSSERAKRLDESLIEDVRAELAERGPLAAAALTGRGTVAPIDWNGWKGTSSAAAMAVEVLWTRCRVVTCGRDRSGRRLYDVPERALGPIASAPGPADLDRSLLLHRAACATLLPQPAGPWWGLLEDARAAGLPERLVDEGALVRVTVEGAKRRWYGLPEALDAADRPVPEGILRPIAPLDPLVWDRALVEAAFGFSYVWEVYKPEAQRKWGYYVVPLLRGDALVGRFEGRRQPDGEVAVLGRWGDVTDAEIADLVARLTEFQQPRAGSPRG